MDTTVATWPDEILRTLPQARVIPTTPKPGDSMAEGGDSVVVYEVNEEDGQWDKPGYLPPERVQAGIYFDSDACTNYGATGSAYAQVARHLIKGNISPADVAELTKHGFIQDGKVMPLSPRYNAIKSGTRHGFGNYMYKPWDSLRNDGIVPEVLCPFPNRQYQPKFLAADYYNQAAAEGPELDAAAAVWKKIFEVRYEIIPTNLTKLFYHARQAPICINVGVCKPWNNEVVPACGLSSGHETVLVGNEGNSATKILDSYVPNSKRLARDYTISYAIKGVVYVRSQQKAPALPPAIKHQWTKPMQYGDQSPEVKILQDFLRLNGCYPSYTSSTGFYGNVTAGAVLKFQIKYKVQDVMVLIKLGGHFVGPATLPVLNKLCS